jgi:hypothetical protein
MLSSFSRLCKQMYTLPSISQMTFEQIFEKQAGSLPAVTHRTATTYGEGNKKGAIKISIKEAESRYEAGYLGGN